MIENNVNWILFNVILALFPLLFNAVLLPLSGEMLKWKDLLKDGELFFFSTSITASSIGTLFLKRPSNLALSVTLGSFLVILLVTSSCLFSLASFQKIKQIDFLDRQLYAVSSVWCSSFAVLLGYLAFCLGGM
jgi:hypothetical protein